MKRINVLNSQTSNKIAAGEVIERPFSVVKELVENSIDAEAKNITIEICEGGQKSIKITDDGFGIHPEDIEKAFLKHATSKISNIDDIYAINTLGFRGEALASIASVSNTILKSRRIGYDYGKEVSISGGEINYIKEIGCSFGTTIEINDLFYNIPARQKFLKSTQRETALISDMLTRIALSNPSVSFKYYKNNKKAFLTYATENMEETIRTLYGKEVYNNIFNFEKHSDIVSVYGYIGNSEISRGSRNKQSIFVNKRLIKSKSITAAVENAFKSFLTINKFPFFILFIDIYPEFIDVNVHPTKSEIRFENDRAIYKIVFDAVHEALRNSLRETFDINFENQYNNITTNKNINTYSNNVEATSENQNQSLNNVEITSENMNQSLNNTPIISDNNLRNNSDITINTNNDRIPVDLKSSSNVDYLFEKSTNENNNWNNNYEKLPIGNTNNKTITNNDKIQESIDIVTNSSKFPELRIIGQFNKTYILAEAFNTLYLIDQHAAHEKILFEKFRNEINNREVISQMLITPLVKELTINDYIIYEENKEVFSNTGFNIEIFGENTISIREVPMLLGKPDVLNLFMDIIDNLKNMGSGSTIEVKYNKIASMSCRAAVKAHDKLSEDEMRHLINDLRNIEDPFTCPHGRPTIIKFSLTELEKKFKRIQ